MSVMLFAPMIANGQARPGSVVVTAHVSETVDVALAPFVSSSSVRLESEIEGRSLHLTLVGDATNDVTVRVPVLVRSNIDYQLSAGIQADSVALTNFAVISASPTGKLTSMAAATTLRIPAEFDGRGNQAATFSNLISSFLFLRGSRVSLAGTLKSPDNALEVVLLLGIRPNAGAKRWSVFLTVSGSPVDNF